MTDDIAGFLREQEPIKNLLIETDPLKTLFERTDLILDKNLTYDLLSKEIVDMFRQGKMRIDLLEESVNKAFYFLFAEFENESVDFSGFVISFLEYMDEHPQYTRVDSIQYRSDWIMLKGLPIKFLNDFVKIDETGYTTFTSDESMDLQKSFIEIKEYLLDKTIEELDVVRVKGLLFELFLISFGLGHKRALQKINNDPKFKPEKQKQHIVSEALLEQFSPGQNQILELDVGELIFKNPRLTERPEEYSMTFEQKSFNSVFRGRKASYELLLEEMSGIFETIYGDIVNQKLIAKDLTYPLTKNKIDKLSNIFKDMKLYRKLALSLFIAINHVRAISPSALDSNFHNDLPLNTQYLIQKILTIAFALCERDWKIFLCDDGPVFPLSREVLIRTVNAKGEMTYMFPLTPSLLLIIEHNGALGWNSGWPKEYLRTIQRGYAKLSHAHPSSNPIYQMLTMETKIRYVDGVFYVAAKTKTPMYFHPQTKFFAGDQVSDIILMINNLRNQNPK